MPVMAGYHVIVGLLVISFTSGCNISWNTLDEKIIQAPYTFTSPPWTVSGANTEVKLKLGISQVKSMGESDVLLTLHLLHTWLDPRTCFNESALSSGHDTAVLAYRNHDYLWSPDVYPEGAVMAKQYNVIHPNVFVRIQPNGTVVKSNRLSVQVHCLPSNTKFPHGNLHCSLRFKIYSFSKSEVSLGWMDEGYSKLDEYSSNVEVDEIKIDTCSHTLFIEEQSCIVITLHVVREFGVYLIRIFLPSAMIVFLSWLSLWIDVRQVPARTGLSVVCVLSLTTQTVGLMVVSDDKGHLIAVDSWMIVCLLYTVWALATFVIAHHQESVLQRRAQTKVTDVNEESKSSKRKSCTETGCSTLERFVKVAYPVSFCLFNLVYWPYFLTA